MYKTTYATVELKPGISSRFPTISPHGASPQPLNASLEDSQEFLCKYGSLGFGIIHSAQTIILVNPDHDSQLLDERMSRK